MKKAIGSISSPMNLTERFNKNRHSGKFSLRALGAKENLSGIRFGFFLAIKNKQIGFRIKSHFCQQEQKSDFSGMTVSLDRLTNA
jgi:hypothetical protein